MVEEGARNLVLVGRKEPSETIRESVRHLERSARVFVCSADVCLENETSRVLTETVERMPVIRGIVHCAGILDDGILLQLNQERFDAVMSPKVRGSWNLHRLTLDQPLDFFVLFSSGASLLGSPGQANYASANAFLDALAHYRRSLGLPALSVNWGRWRGVGLASRRERANRLDDLGIRGFSVAEGLNALKRLLLSEATQIAVMPFDFETWRRHNPGRDQSKVFDELMKCDGGSGQGKEVNRRVGDAAGLKLGEAISREALEFRLAEKLSKVLGLAEGSRLDRRMPMSRFGMDSLMAVELKTSIAAEFGVSPPIMNFLGRGTLAEVSIQVLDLLSSREARAGVSVDSVVGRFGVETDGLAQMAAGTNQSAKATGQYWEETVI
jgi:myxalamid-type polyketide synthase MxaE and MxaD